MEGGCCVVVPFYFAVCFYYSCIKLVTGKNGEWRVGV